jgi:hypothetical protein
MLGENIGNLGNILRTYWEHYGNQKNPTPTTHHLHQRKRIGCLGCMLAHVVGCEEFPDLKVKTPMGDAFPRHWLGLR